MYYYYSTITTSYSLESCSWCGCDDSHLWSIRKRRSNFTMWSSDWDSVSDFAAAVGWKLLFDANVLLRRGSKWDPDNLRSLLEHSAGARGQNRTHVAWELGNEPNSLRHQLNVTLPPLRLGRDFGALRRLLDSFPAFAGATLVGPDVNHLDKCADYSRGRMKRCRRET